jgi:hypothetical protein
VSNARHCWRWTPAHIYGLCFPGQTGGGANIMFGDVASDEEAITSVPVACPMGQSEAVCSGHSRTTQDIL